MIKNSSIAIIIPLYNEEETLGDLFYKIDGVYRILRDEYSIKFMLVNDGSTDSTGRLLEEKYGESPFVTILIHEKNAGYGAGLRTGFQEALGNGFQYIVTIDADTNYDQFLIPYFIYEFNPEKEDIMAASPWHPSCSKRNFPLIRYILSNSMALLYHYILQPECPSLTCYSACFRLYKREVLENIQHEADDFLTNSEIIVRALLHGYRVKEMPVNVNYRLMGISKMKKIPQIMKHLRYMLYLLRNKQEMVNREKKWSN
jgi:glycosyltransferase involved in cell wall biosynthesis